MKTKIAYVLVSSHRDLFWEQCLISVMSLRHHMPDAHTVLVCDTETKESLKAGIRNELSNYFSEIISISFDEKTGNTKRSRILKVTLREIITGDFLYIDCDTLITQQLCDIDNLSYPIAAVLDGHCLFKSHPMREFFLKQNKHLDYAHDSIVKYFNAGVMYVKDIEETHSFYKLWHDNYLTSCEKGIYLDEPALSKTNIELGNVIQEINGTWNCQIRFGALFLATNKILHFCSKKNMPVSILSNKVYLRKIKEHGVDTFGLLKYIADWRSSISPGMVTCFGNDASFAVSPCYEKQRYDYITHNTAMHLYNPKLSFREKIQCYKNRIIGLISPRFLSCMLYKEAFGKKIQNAADNDFNKMLHMLAFYSDISEWPLLADKLAVRKYITDKGLSRILPDLYAVWESANSIKTETLPPQYVLKCNHDNGSSMSINDNYSIDGNYIKSFYKKKLSKCFGLETAEPHYRIIPRRIYAEELLENDKSFSDSLVSYKFFSFYGKTDYCQVIYDSKHHHNQKSIVYKITNWEKQQGFILKNEGSLDIPCPDTITEMKNVIEILTAHLPFCRVDLYECKNKVYFSELTFMPGAGRIKGFSQKFLNILGQQLNQTKQQWIR